MMLSAIIPCWCERDVLADSIRAASTIADEVIVVDADSPDGSAAVAVAVGARVIQAPRGRGQQLAAGAATARGDVLLFLHADARLPARARHAIERALRGRDVAGGNFRLRFEPASAWAGMFGWLNHHRRRLLRIYYGDSGVFVRRDVYDALGGFDAVPIMEDHKFVQRLERGYRTAYITDVEIVASSRRFAAAPVRTIAIWTMLQTLASAGVSPERLARMYADLR